MRSHGNGHHSDAVETIAMIDNQGLIAFRNRQFSSGDPQTITSPTATSDINLVAVPMVVKASGLFAVNFQLDWTASTLVSADTYTFKVTSQTQAAAIPLTNGTLSGPGLVQVSHTSGAGISVTGGPFGAVLQYSSGVQLANAEATVAYTGQLSYNGICQNTVAAGVSTPFAAGANVVFLFSLNLSAHAIVMGGSGLSVDVYELP